MSRNNITIEDRFKHGEFSLQELGALKNSGMTRLYADINAGRLPTVKRGRSRRVLGPVAARYQPGIGLVDETAEAAGQ
jgi:hypothetical protein